jgi:hypothetical protein
MVYRKRLDRVIPLEKKIWAWPYLSLSSSFHVLRGNVYKLKILIQKNMEKVNDKSKVGSKKILPILQCPFL